MIVTFDLLVGTILIGVSLLLIGLNYLIGNIGFIELNPSYEKISSYECGFDAFSDSRAKFDIKFYLIAILFIIFDVEVIFFFPYTLAIKELFFVGIIHMIVFMIILLIGFLYEWRKGCMDYT